jgi:hypothetical protein
MCRQCETQYAALASKRAGSVIFCAPCLALNWLALILINGVRKGKG